MNIDYRAFIRDNIAFARTIVIKNEDIAVADNQLMLQYYGIPVPQDKSKWRYYLNLAGEYHQTDDLMTVKSLDNEEIIPFTRASLDDHPATRKAYRLGSYYFSRLAAKYPHQIELIQGIINPIPYEDAVKARNYQILRYTQSYVEWNESQLIPLLQAHIDGITYQSFSTEYKFTDNLMLPFLVAHLRETVLRFLITCRFEHRFSRHAHSFFVWSHLQSKGISKVYKPFLNEHQTMWLFRNIDYLLRHLGKSQNFDLLIAHLLSERDIALTKYDLIQSTETLADTLSPTPLFHSERINLIDKKGKGEDNRTLPVVMTKEIPESLDNSDFYTPFLASTTYESTYGEINSYPTKILESEMIDATNSKAETFFMLLNNELIYLASKDLYTINLDIEDPLTGIHHTIPVKDAIVLWHDLLNLYHGIDNDKIGYFCYQGVMKITPPSLSAIMKTGTLPFLDEGWCRDVLKLHIPQIRMVSPTVFYENALAIFHTKWKHKKMASFWASWGYVSQRQNAVDSLYEIGFAKLTPFTSFKALREKYQFDFSGYEKPHYLNLMWTLWRKMTGWDNFSHQTLAQLQEALINLMRHMSSYSLQYIYQTNVESGWYEAGVDLMTENPSLANRGEDNGNELENDQVDASTIIDEHKVLTIEEAESIAEYELATLHFDTEYEDTTTDALWDNMRLALVEFDKDDGTEGDIHTFPLYLDMVPTLAYAMVEDNLDKLIPTVTSVPEYQALSSVFTPFDGLLKATPFTAVTMRVVKNGFDNENVLYDYHGLDASPQVLTSVNGTNRHYDMSFVPAQPGDYILRLDIITTDSSQQNKQGVARFDYPYTVKAADWTIKYDIPDSVTVGTPFDITPVITGLTLSGAAVTKQTWQVDDSIKDYLTVQEKDGKLQGTLVKNDWPTKLPLHYCLTTGEGNTARRYYMTGYVPSDRVFDPLTEKDFIPTLRFNTCVKHALVTETVSVIMQKAGWTVTDLKVDRASQDNLIDDLSSLKGWLTPTVKKVSNTTNTDGRTLANWTVRYGMKDPDKAITLPLTITLTSSSGKTLTRSFTWTPAVKDYQATPDFILTPLDLQSNESREDYLYGLNYKTSAWLGPKGISGNQDASKTPITVTRVSNVQEVVLNNTVGLPTSSDYPLEVANNQGKVYVQPRTLTSASVVELAAAFVATVKTDANDVLPLLLYGLTSIKGSNIVDYDVFDLDGIDLWSTDNNLYRHAIVPVRYKGKKSHRGWEMQDMTIADSAWPSYIPTQITFTSGYRDFIEVRRSFYYGKEKDGPEALPTGYAYWITLYCLYNKQSSYPDNPTIPIQMTARNRYTGKTQTTTVNIPVTLSDRTLLMSCTPDQIYSGVTTNVTPHWTGIPFETPKPMVTESRYYDGYGATGFSKNVNGKYVYGSAKYQSDGTYNITLPEPRLTPGSGIWLTCSTQMTMEDPEWRSSSLSFVKYYQIVQLLFGQNVYVAYPPPSLDYINLTMAKANPTLMRGTLTGTTFTYKTKDNWKMSEFTLHPVDNSDIQADIQPLGLYDVPVKSDGYIQGYLPDIGTINGRDSWAGDIRFVPAKSGKQTLHLTAVMTNQPGNGLAYYRFDKTFEVDVSEPDEDFVLLNDDNRKDPLVFPIGKTTTVHVVKTSETGKQQIYGTEPVIITPSTGLTVKGGSGFPSSRFTVKVPSSFTPQDVQIALAIRYNWAPQWSAPDNRAQRYYYIAFTLTQDQFTRS